MRTGAASGGTGSLSLSSGASKSGSAGDVAVSVGSSGSSGGAVITLCEIEVWGVMGNYDPCSGIDESTYVAQCINSVDTWPEAIDIGAVGGRGMVCEVLVQTLGGNCRTYCEDQGGICAYAWDNDGSNTDAAGCGVCTGCTHDEADNGCNQNWQGQLCGCSMTGSVAATVANIDASFGAFTGGDSDDGLDLCGDFKYAVDVLGDGGVTAGDAAFTKDDVAGVAVVAQNAIPSWGSTNTFGDSSSDDAMESVMKSIRWSGYPNQAKEIGRAHV